MPHPRLPAQARFLAIAAVHRHLVHAQDALEGCNDRDRKRLHLQGVGLHDVLGELRDVCEGAQGRLRGVDPRQRVVTPPSRIRWVQVYVHQDGVDVASYRSEEDAVLVRVSVVLDSLRDVADERTRRQIASQLAEGLWDEGAHLYCQATGESFDVYEIPAVSEEVDAETLEVSLKARARAALRVVAPTLRGPR